MIYLYLFGTCFHFIYVFMIIDKEYKGAVSKTIVLIQLLLRRVRISKM